MAWDIKKLVKTTFRELVPQYFNKTRDEYEVIEGEGGAMNVAVARRSTADVTLQDTATVSGGGTVFVIGGYVTLTFEVYGTSTSRMVVFEGLSVSGSWVPVMCVNISTSAAGIQTTGTGEVWQADVTGLVQFRARLGAVGGGSVTVKGRVVA